MDTTEDDDMYDYRILLPEFGGRVIRRELEAGREDLHGRGRRDEGSQGTPAAAPAGPRPRPLFLSSACLLPPAGFFC